MFCFWVFSGGRGSCGGFLWGGYIELIEMGEEVMLDNPDMIFPGLIDAV